MQKKLLFSTIIIPLLFAACSKDQPGYDVDYGKYEAVLSQDYSSALQFHNASNTKNSSYEYNSMMFRKNDSLFSIHFYEFCNDMMQNGSKHHGKGGKHGGMMNGFDRNKVRGYMDSVFHSGQNMRNPDFRHIDSLMINTMSQCGMMSQRTNTINSCLNQMQSLRRTHKKQLTK